MQDAYPQPLYYVRTTGLTDIFPQSKSLTNPPVRVPLTAGSVSAKHVELIAERNHARPRPRTRSCAVLLAHGRPSQAF
jgi:hypothetical protein